MSETYTPVVSEPAFTLQMVEKYRDLLLKCAGLKSINIDGHSVSYGELEQQYDHWSKKLARINNTRPRVAQINLGNV